MNHSFDSSRSGGGRAEARRKAGIPGDGKVVKVASGCIGRTQPVMPLSQAYLLHGRALWFPPGPSGVHLTLHCFIKYTSLFPADLIITYSVQFLQFDIKFLEASRYPQTYQNLAAGVVHFGDL